MVRRNSSGQPILNHTMRLAFQEGLLPRQLKGCLLFPSKQAKGWVAIYIKAPRQRGEEKQAIFWDKYTQPQVGGNFVVDEEVSPWCALLDMSPACSSNSHFVSSQLFFKYNFFYKFTKQKVYCAFLLKKMESFMSKKGTAVIISNNGVQDTILKWCRAKRLAGSKSDDDVLTAFLFNTMCKTTLVAYPCAVHRDN